MIEWIPLIMFLAVFACLLLGYPVALTLSGVALLFGFGGMIGGSFNPSDLGFLSLTAVVGFILWILFKPKKKRPKKKVRLKKKSALKNQAKKQENIDAISKQMRRKKAEQMKKDPEVIRQILRIWLNEK